MSPSADDTRSTPDPLDSPVEPRSPPPVYALIHHHPPHLGPVVAPPGFGSLPPSAYSLECKKLIRRAVLAITHCYLPARFRSILREKAGEWWLICYESRLRAPFLILSGSISPSLALTRDQALMLIDDTITWHRWLRNDATWSPAEGAYLFFSYFFCRF